MKKKRTEDDFFMSPQHGALYYVNKTTACLQPKSLKHSHLPASRRACLKELSRLRAVSSNPGRSIMTVSSASNDPATNTKCNIENSLTLSPGAGCTKGG